MASDKISLMIFGNKTNAGGWNPIIDDINTPPFPDLTNIRPGGLGDNVNYLLIRIDKNYTQYTLVFNPQHIKASDGMRDGALKMAFSIPRGYKLDKGATPYNVLINLWHTLEEEVLVKVPGTDNVFRFTAGEPDRQKFVEALSEFRLIPTDSPHRPMSDTSTKVGIILADEEKTELLLNDVQYSEFAPYKEIAVAKFGESENMITGLTIPRKPRYEIYANNKKISDQLPAYNYGYSDTILIDCVKFYNLNSRAYENKTLEFTVDEVLQGKYPEFVTVDRIHEEINVSVPSPKPRRLKHFLHLDGSSDTSLFEKIRIKVNGRERPISADNSIELEGEELVNSPLISFSLYHDDYTKEGEPVIKGFDIFLPVKKVEKTEVEKFIGNSGKKKNGVSLDKEEGKKHSNIFITLSLQDPKDISDLEKEYKVTFANNIRTFSQNLTFKPLKKGKAAYAAQIEIPASWEGYYKISLVTDAIKFNSQGPVLLAHNQSNDIFIPGNQTDQLTWKDKNKKTLKWLLPLIYTLLYTAAVAVITMIIYHAVEDFKHRHRDDRNENIEQFERQQAQLGQGVVAGNSDRQKEGQIDLTSQIIQSQNALKNEAITFAEIRKINDWIQANDAEISKLPEGKDLKERINVYMAVINVVENPQQRSLGKVEEVYNKYNKLFLLEEVHRKYVTNLWSALGNASTPGYKTNKSYVIERLKENKVYNSFMEIPAAADIVKSKTTSTPSSGASGNRGGNAANNGSNDNTGNSGQTSIEEER